MHITVGTFNLNNLFSRYNFMGEIEAIKDGDTEVGSVEFYTFDDPQMYKIRKYMGRLVKAKSESDRTLIAQRTKNMNVDVLAVQEVEDINILQRFVKEDLDNLYPYKVLVEGNDPRLIDVGLLSKLPIGGVTSWRHAVHPDDTTRPVFGRDLLEVEIFNQTRSKRLFTVFNNHLKSHFVPFFEDQEEGAQKTNERRKRQAEIIAQIVQSRMRPNSRYIILGDMNDPHDSPWLEPMIFQEPELVNALQDPIETSPAKADDPPPATTAWTHRYKPSHQPAEYELYDQIWLSPFLADKQIGSWIGRRKKHSGDGSDHDPAWIELNL